MTDFLRKQKWIPSNNLTGRIEDSEFILIKGNKYPKFKMQQKAYIKMSSKDNKVKRRLTVMINLD